MRSKHWMVLVALIGVLLHAGLIVRHNAMALSAKLDHAALATLFGFICHGNGGVSRLPASEQPALPEQEQDRGSCPICAGMAPAFAVLTDMLLPCQAHDTVSFRMAVVGKIIHVRLAAVCPPSCGPPAFV